VEGVTLDELVRRVESVERRQSDFVLQAVYTRDMNEIRNDIGEIKDSQKWAMRLIAGQFVALVVALLIWVVQQVPT
jgi:hypothetical protein